MRRLATSLLAVAAAAIFAPPAAGQDAPPPAVLEDGVVQDGVLAEVGQVDRFQVKVPTGLGVLRVTVAQTNDECEVWAHVIDRGGTELSSTFATRAGTSLATESVSEDTFIVAVDSGPLRTCAGAHYAIVARHALLDLDALTVTAFAAPSPPPRASAAASLVRCQIYCNAAAQTATRVRRLTTAIRRARGGHRRRLIRARDRVRASYRKYHRLERKWCRRAGLA